MNKLENFKNVIIITWYILKTESSIVNGEYSPQKNISHYFIFQKTGFI